MHKYLALIFLVSFSALAQDLPEHLQDMLVRSQDYFQIYAQKSPSEIQDGKYDESELLLISQVDQTNTLDVVFSKDEIKKTKLKMLDIVANTFDAFQLIAIVNITKSPALNKIQTARFFEVALEYKTGKFQVLNINRQLSPLYKSR